MQEIIRKYRKHGCGCPPKQGWVSQALARFPGCRSPMTPKEEEFDAGLRGHPQNGFEGA